MAEVSAAEFAWREWFLGEGRFAKDGRLNPRVRERTGAPGKVPREWWQRLEAFIAKRDGAEPGRFVPARQRLRARLPHRRALAAGRVSPHFNLAEFHCHDGTRVPQIAVPALEQLARDFLEPLRAQFGTTRVMSGYRHRAYNKRVGGATFSQHIYELTPTSVAADLIFERGTPRQWANAARRIAQRKKLGGVGDYDSFVHVDNGPRRDWSG